MAHQSSWLKLFGRLCILAVLCASVVYLATESKVVADSSTTCIRCDQNNVVGLSNCNGNRDSCYQQCTIVAAPNPPNPACIATCDNQYLICQTNTWNTYDNCLYGFTDFSGLCSITAIAGLPPPSGRGRTPCDFACRDQLRECSANGGTSCGEDYNVCVLSCG
jgi:hypothetical protein